MATKFFSRFSSTKLIVSVVLSLLASSVAVAPAHAVNAPSVDAAVAPDVGGLIHLTGTFFDTNGMSVLVSSSGLTLSATNITPTTADVVVPENTTIVSPAVSVNVTITVVNVDLQSGSNTLTYKSSIPQFAALNPASFKGGSGAKALALTADTTCAPLFCYFASGVTGSIQFPGGAPQTLTITGVTATTATVNLPAHSPINTLQTEVGHVIIQNPNGMSAVFDYTYYSAPAISFPTSSNIAPIVLPVGTPMSTINLIHTSGHCDTISGSGAVPGVAGISWTWNSVSQTGSISGTATADTSATLFTVTCSNPGGVDSSATIYLSAHKLNQTVGPFTLSGVTTVSPGHYSTTYGNAAPTISLTREIIGNPYSVVSNDPNVVVSGSSGTGFTLTILGPTADATLTASMPATATYNAATPDAVVHLAVAKAPQTISGFAISGASGSAPNYTTTFGNSALTYSFVAAPAINGGATTVTSSDPGCVSVDQVAKTLTITCVPVSQVTLTASTAATANYDASSNSTLQLTVQKGQLGVTFTPALLMIAGGPAQDLSIHASLTPLGIGAPFVVHYTVAPASASVCSLNSTDHTLTALTEGNCLVTASVAGNTNMLDAVPVTRTIVVKLASAQSLTFSGLVATYTYGASDVTFHVTDLFGDSLQVSNTFPNTGSVTQTGPNTWVFHVNQVGKAVVSAYDPMTRATNTFAITVAPKPLTVSPFMASVSQTGVITLDSASLIGVIAGDYVQLDSSRVVLSYSSNGVLSWSGSFALSGSSAQNYVLAAQPSSIAVHPAVFAVSPAFGSPVGGNSVTITGVGFLPGSKVYFGSNTAATVQYVSSTTLNVVTPAHTVGSTSVTVALPGAGVAAGSVAFEFKPLAPVILSVSPPSSSVLGGSVLQISGENFASDIALTLDGVPVGIQSVSAHSITFSTPAHVAGAVKLTLTNPGLPAVTWVNDLIYILPIEVNPISIVKSFTSGGSKLSLFGNNFATGITVSIMGIQATNVVVVDAHTVSFTIPAVPAAGLQDILIRTPEGQSVSLAGAVRFIANPVLVLNAGTTGALNAKQLAAVKKFTVSVAKTGLKATNVVISVSVSSPKPNKAATKSGKAFASNLKVALVKNGLKKHTVISVTFVPGKPKINANVSVN